MNCSFEKSTKAFEEAKGYLPGGVNSPVRAFKSVGRDPIFMEKGEGAYLTDIDGNVYIDYLQSWGPMILGHRHPRVEEAIITQVQRGTHFGTPTLSETALAKKIQEFLPSMELMRMGTSGTEVTMSAIRLARGVTGRELIIKFDGCYHGHGDSFLIEAGSGVATFGLADSPGVPKALANLSISLPYNDVNAVSQFFKERGNEVAAVIVEPVAGNMGCVPGKKEFLEALRRLTIEYGSILIFDEVMSGFRAGLHSAQGYYDICPDLTTLGKVVGSGLPVAVYGGRKELMEHIAPQGSVYQAGTLSGNPIGMVAGRVTLEELNEENYQELEEKTQILCEGIQSLGDKYNIPLQVNSKGTMFSVFYQGEEVFDYESAKKSNTQRFTRIYQSLLQEGIYMAPSQFETNFMSLAISKEDIEKTLFAFEKAFQGEVIYSEVN